MGSNSKKLVWAENGSQRAENGWSNEHVVSLTPPPPPKKKKKNPWQQPMCRIVGNWSGVVILPYGMQFYSNFVVL